MTGYGTIRITIGDGIIGDGIMVGIDGAIVIGTHHTYTVGIDLGIPGITTIHIIEEVELMYLT